jgi:hypothetical protein
MSPKTIYEKHIDIDKGFENQLNKIYMLVKQNVIKSGSTFNTIVKMLIEERISSTTNRLTISTTEGVGYGVTAPEQKLELIGKIITKTYHGRKINRCSNT